ncbi:MAG TPA: sigma-70 family RNA polymerase sigma factor [Gemmataceae bacterium]|jgi:RNA polymerase sigma-70 factor (ECF subfamily)|nr:sigma-70 family RNA polymerase sigma factor [Gemmataceae bacterium]
MTDWSQIVREYGPIVWRTAHRLLHHDADAADCFQRTFVSALELSRTETVRHWAGLLGRLATARALELLRQRQRDANRLQPLLSDACVSVKTPGPDRAAEASELADQLRGALAELDPRQAQVFCLACLEGWRYEEIAQQLGLKVNHVGVLLNRARTTLRERLRSHEPAAARRQREAQ